MALLCSVCGDAFLPVATGWWEDWCQDCTERNFSQVLELRLHEAQPTAREALEAAACTPLTTRQRSHMERLHAHWEAEARRRMADAS